ncbi:hypothetical protein [Methylomonas albis]|uniref:ABC transporter substrate-binding protein n=1 Tax=Methylomonas albis TaxID=1854563 RepID=A0ABR9D3Q2_9GAMM|nr:hypothetical protein [Methylomonas albis]MBD9357411.1 hypothetical protein [Methylomonas albis]CAD6880674.1 hypothetical protein [Methylomonas albis]
MNARISKALLRLWLILISCKAIAEEPHVLVLYPAAAPPISSIYATTIKGIKTRVKRIDAVAIPETARLADVKPSIDRIHPDIIIALGNQAAEFIKPSPYRSQSLLGLVYFDHAESHGVSLRLDSQILTSNLQRLTPRIRQVFIVENSSHLILQQDSSATTSKPLLTIRTGNDMKTTMRILGELLEHDATPEDSILIPADIPKDILYEASNIAWRKNIALLSTNLSHLEYGVLMTFNPNLLALGEQLGDMANQQTVTYEPMKKVDVALNQRVAQHMDMHFDPSALSAFSLVLE